MRIVAEQALASKASEVIVVTGHQAELVEQALAGLKVKFVRNPDFAGGLASSVKAGIAAVPEDADGAVVCLGDMPLIDAHLIDRLIQAFAPDRGHLIAVPVSDGRRGNPVLWSRRFFSELMTLDGDVGARHLIAKHGEAVAEVPVEGHGAFLDIDTPQALEAARYFVGGQSVLAPCPPSRVPPVMEGTSALLTLRILEQLMQFDTKIAVMIRTDSKHGKNSISPPSLQAASPPPFPNASASPMRTAPHRISLADRPADPDLRRRPPRFPARSIARWRATLRPRSIPRTCSGPRTTPPTATWSRR